MTMDDASLPGAPRAVVFSQVFDGAGWQNFSENRWDVNTPGNADITAFYFSSATHVITEVLAPGASATYQVRRRIQFNENIEISGLPVVAKTWLA